MPPKPKSRLRIAWLGCLFADTFYRRVGWQEGWRPYHDNVRLAHEWRIGPLLIFWNKRERFKDMLWIKDGFHATDA